MPPEILTEDMLYFIYRMLNVFMGIRPVVVALIAVPVFNVAKSAKIGWSTVWIPLLSAFLIVAMGVSPVYVILLAGIAGFVWGKFRRDEA